MYTRLDSTPKYRSHTTMPTADMAATAKKIKDSVADSLASMLPKNKRKGSRAHALPAECLLGLVSESGMSCYLKYRLSGSLPQRYNWKKVFVILVNSALYIYDDKTSKSPRNCVSLVTFNCVRRVKADKSSQWPFAVISAEDPDTMEVFDCSSDRERIDWMRRVRDSLCNANHVEPRKMSIADQFASNLDSVPLIIDETEYQLLEEPLFQVTTADNRVAGGGFTGARIGNKNNGFEDDDDDDDSDGGAGFGDEEESYDVGIWCRLKRQDAIKRKSRSSDSSTKEEQQTSDRR